MRDSSTRDSPIAFARFRFDARAEILRACFRQRAKIWTVGTVKSSKRPSKRSATSRGKRPVKVSSPSSQPFLRFYHSKSLRAKTLAVLTTLEKAKDSTQHRDALADIVEKARLGKLQRSQKVVFHAAVGQLHVEQSANLGMAGTTRVLASVMHGQVQLLTVCSYIRQLME